MTNNASPKGPLITDSQRPIESASDNIKRWMRPSQFTYRVYTMFDHTIFPGWYVFTECKHIKPIYLPQLVRLPDGNNHVKRILIQSRNEADKFLPKLVSCNALRHAIVLLPYPAHQDAMFKKCMAFGEIGAD
jgi:hypothetical protein